MSTANLQQRLNDLFGYIRQGKIIEAMNEFYDKDTVMQEMPIRRRRDSAPTLNGKNRP